MMMMLSMIMCPDTGIDPVVYTALLVIEYLETENAYEWQMAGFQGF